LTTAHWIHASFVTLNGTALAYALHTMVRVAQPRQGRVRATGCPPAHAVRLRTARQTAQVDPIHRIARPIRAQRTETLAQVAGREQLEPAAREIPRPVEPERRPLDLGQPHRAPLAAVAAPVAVVAEHEITPGLDLERRRSRAQLRVVEHREVALADRDLATPSARPTSSVKCSPLPRLSIGSPFTNTTPSTMSIRSPGSR
jgi:hypothetical protein